MFPKELPLSAARQVARFLTGQDKDWGRFALAGWELTGFGLGKAFPDATYLSDAGPLSEPTQETLKAVASADDVQLATLSPEVESLLTVVLPMLLKLLLARLK